MQNDTGLPFTEIYGSAEPFLTAIEEIEQVALTQRSDDAPLQIRLLTPYGNNKSTSDFAITPIASFRGDEEYVAVSYAWAHEESTAAVQVPDYRIWDLARPNEPPRTPKCPPTVFHRAIRYAQAKGILYVWIDQECIYQNDDADREQHLQAMHRIYRAGAVTIAILSVPMRDIPTLEEFLDWVRRGKEPTGEQQTLATGRLADWLLSMTRDKWFTRAWTMHEKLCSKRLEYIIPLAMAVDTSTYQHLLVDKDIAVDVTRSVANYNMTMSPEPGVLTAYQQLGKWLWPHASNRDEITLNIEYALHELGQRENSVLSDRLAIIANVCNLPYTLDTTVLRCRKVSYRTCLLVLTFANVWPDAEERRAKYRRFALHDTGQDVSPASNGTDDIMEEFLERPRIGEDMRWIHYDLKS